jgi:hypothetical protein
VTFVFATIRVAKDECPFEVERAVLLLQERATQHGVVECSGPTGTQLPRAGCTGDVRCILRVGMHALRALASGADSGLGDETRTG